MAEETKETTNKVHYTFNPFHYLEVAATAILNRLGFYTSTTQEHTSNRSDSEDDGPSKEGKINISSSTQEVTISEGNPLTTQGGFLFTESLVATKVNTNYINKSPPGPGVGEKGEGPKHN